MAAVLENVPSTAIAIAGRQVVRLEDGTGQIRHERVRKSEGIAIFYVSLSRIVVGAGIRRVYHFAARSPA